MLSGLEAQWPLHTPAETVFMWWAAKDSALQIMKERLEDGAENPTQATGP